MTVGADDNGMSTLFRDPPPIRGPLKPASWVYFASDGPQFLRGSRADLYLPADADRLRLLPLFDVPLWEGQPHFAHFYGLTPKQREFVSFYNPHFDQSLRRDPVYLGIPMDPQDEPEVIERESLLSALCRFGTS